MKKFGIDISVYQGNFDFDKAVNEGVSFVNAKGGGGDDGYYVDSKFARNYTEAKKKGLPLGVYWFSRALTVAQAKAEAEYFYSNVLKGRQFELPVYIDVENRTQLSVGKRALTDIIKAWCNTLANKGYFVGIYSSLSFFDSYMYDNELTSYAHWIAQWSSKCSYANTSCLGMWQFGGETNYIRANKVAGQVCDQDYMLIDYPSAIQTTGLNGFSKTADTKTTDKKSVDILAQEVINGKWGNGDDRKKRLTAAGYDYNAVQNKVNELLSRKTVEQLAKEVIMGKWGNGSEREKKLTAAGYDYNAVQAKVNQMLR